MTFKPFLAAVFSCLFILPISADIKDDIWKASKEKSKLTRKVSSMFRKLKIKDSELDELQNKAMKASMTFMNARKEHPDLKPLYKLSHDAQSRLVKATMAKDDAAKKAARSDYTEARMKLEKKSREIPEFMELQNKAIEANKAVKARKVVLLAGTPEGKVLIDQINALEAQISELQKQL